MMKTKIISLLMASLAGALQAQSFSPSRVLARSLTEPSCLQVQADEMPADPNPILANKQIDENLPSLLGRLKKILKQGQKYALHHLAMRSARVVYELSDLETTRKPEKFFDGFLNFVKQIPAGYSLYYAFSDPRYGLKYAFFSPTTETTDTPWILAVAGTQTMKDWIADTDLGRKQLERLSRLFTKCLFRDSTGRMLFDRKLLVTGHSLGGGLAQALAYEIQRRLLPFMPEGTESPLTLVTWNAFGGRELVEKVGTYNAELARTMDMTNYFVQRDVVSKIGTHIGWTREMIPSPPMGAIAAHSMATIESLVGPDSYTFATFAEATPPFSERITGLTRLGPFFVNVPPVFFYARRNERLDVLMGAAKLAADVGARAPGTNSLMLYIRLLANDERERMLHDGQLLLADSFMRSLAQSEARMRAAR